jgi:hypothetical protein
MATNGTWYNQQSHRFTACLRRHGDSLLDAAREEVQQMQFKEALRAAGLANPGRTTWSGITSDKTPVFTIWEHEIYKLNGRWFAGWNHDAECDVELELSAKRKGTARMFIKRASLSNGCPVRGVVVISKYGNEGKVTVDEAFFPHPKWASAVFRFADQDAYQFVAELFPEQV